MTSAGDLPQALDRSRRKIPYAAWKGITGRSYSPPFQDEKWLASRFTTRVQELLSADLQPLYQQC